MRRLTILGLMVLVLGLAVAIAALRNANDTWAGGLLLATPLLIGIAAIGAAYQSGLRRAGRLGFAVFGGGYFALTFIGYSHQNLAKLPTSWILSYVHEQARPPLLTAATSTVGPPGATTTIYSTTGLPPAFTAKPTVRWNSLLPGAANHDAFMVVGHCLFTLLAGLLGAVIARRCRARQERALESGTGG